MGTLIFWLLVAIAVLLSIPVTVFFLEILAAVALPQRQRSVPEGGSIRGQVAVLVPAHDESQGMLPTLADIRGQLRAGDRLLAVADNCSDDTAAVAAVAGAEVIERRDPKRRGKGYAMDFGLRHLASRPPDIVIIVDADCRLSPDAIDRLAAVCAATGRPAQALYLMSAPQGARVPYQVAEFAWRVKNWLRPLGLAALELPTHLTGTGMAFPWEVIRSANLASGAIVEDLKLGLDLTASKHPPLFCADASVTSHFASTVEGANTQRLRWEQGYIDTILRVAPGLFCQALIRRDLSLLALTLDLAVPPLSLLAILVLAMFAISAFFALLSSSFSVLLLSTATLIEFLFATILAWLKVGRDVLPARAVWTIGSYVLGKLGLYRRIFFDGGHVRWIRTDRTKSE